MPGASCPDQCSRSVPRLDVRPRVLPGGAERCAGARTRTVALRRGREVEVAFRAAGLRGVVLPHPAPAATSVSRPGAETARSRSTRWRRASTCGRGGGATSLVRTTSPGRRLPAVIVSEPAYADGRRGGPRILPGCCAGCHGRRSVHWPAVGRARRRAVRPRRRWPDWAVCRQLDGGSARSCAPSWSRLPPRPHVLARRHMVDRLRAVSAPGRLTLVAAGAGSGKTTPRRPAARNATSTSRPRRSATVRVRAPAPRSAPPTGRTRGRTSRRGPISDAGSGTTHPA